LVTLSLLSKTAVEKSTQKLSDRQQPQLKFPRLQIPETTKRLKTPPTTPTYPYASDLQGLSAISKPPGNDNALNARIRNSHTAMPSSSVWPVERPKVISSPVQSTHPYQQYFRPQPISSSRRTRFLQSLQPTVSVHERESSDEDSITTLDHE